MILRAISLPPVERVCGSKLKARVDGDTGVISVQLFISIYRISFAYVQRQPTQRLPRGRRPRLLLRGGRRSLLFAVGGVAGDRDPRGGSRDPADRAPSRRRQANRCR